MTIQEMSEKARVSTHTLRFWERVFEGVIVPLRTKGGQRRYTTDQLFMIEEIKRSRSQGLSLPDIKAALKSSAIATATNDSGPQLDLLANQIDQVVRSTIYNFFERKGVK
jgi:DNA-binding transcriptional MerR regulator